MTRTMNLQILKIKWSWNFWKTFRKFFLSTTENPTLFSCFSFNQWSPRYFYFRFPFVTSGFKNSSFTGSWLLEGLLSDDERIKCGIKNRIDRLKQITSQVSNAMISEKILRRWAQLSIIFGLTDQTLEYLLSSTGNTFNEDSLRGLLLVMLKDNAANVSWPLVLIVAREQ